MVIQFSITSIKFVFHYKGEKKERHFLLFSGKGVHANVSLTSNKNGHSFFYYYQIFFLQETKFLLKK